MLARHVIGSRFGKGRGVATVDGEVACEGLLSFIIFRGSVMMYMSLQGAVMFIFGALALLLKYPDVGKQIADHMASKPFILPAAIFIPATIGLIYQQAQYSAPAEKKK